MTAIPFTFTAPAEPQHFALYTSHGDDRPAKFLSFEELTHLAMAPTIRPKEKATLLTPFVADGRKQEHASAAPFWAIVIDHDNDDLSLEQLERYYSPYAVKTLAFTTTSHQQQDDRHPVKQNRWKVVIPLADAGSADQVVPLSQGLTYALKADPAQARKQQGFYAPNRLTADAPYDWFELEGEPLDINDTSHPLIVTALEGLQAMQDAEEAKAKVAAVKPRSDALASQHGDIIGKIRHSDSMHNVLTRNGYKRRGRAYLSPFSQSGAAGVYILRGEAGEERVYSHHGEADPLSNLNHNGHSLDLLDVLTALEHGGDVRRAIADQANAVDPEGQKQRQREYMAAQEAAAIEQALTGSGAPATQTNEQTTAAEDLEPLFDLARFSLKGKSAEMKAKMLDDKFILGRMAILGQATVFYAKPNTGKTLLTLWLLLEAVKSGEIKGEDVFYINADDNHKGLTEKNELVEVLGIHMLAPGYNGFKSEHLPFMLAALAEQETARGKVLILDTVKKFTDLMDKKKGSEFMESVRQFVAHGGTVIMLAHVNKNRGEDGKVIFAGTSDMVDDADCAYTLDEVTKDALSGDKTVKFENFKSRGDVANEEVYRYDAGPGKNYLQRLQTVTVVSADERKEAEAQKALAIRLDINREAIEAIKEVLREGISKKTDLINAAIDRSGLTRRKITKALTDHTGPSISNGQYWHLKIGDKNAHVYQLNYGL